MPESSGDSSAAGSPDPVTVACLRSGARRRSGRDRGCLRQIGAGSVRRDPGRGQQDGRGDPAPGRGRGRADHPRREPRPGGGVQGRAAAWRSLAPGGPAPGEQGPARRRHLRHDRERGLGRPRGPPRPDRRRAPARPAAAHPSPGERRHGPRQGRLRARRLPAALPALAALPNLDVAGSDDRWPAGGRTRRMRGRRSGPCGTFPTACGTRGRTFEGARAAHRRRRTSPGPGALDGHERRLPRSRSRKEPRSSASGGRSSASGPAPRARTAGPPRT